MNRYSSFHGSNTHSAEVFELETLLHTAEQDNVKATSPSSMSLSFRMDKESMKLLRRKLKNKTPLKSPSSAKKTYNKDRSIKSGTPLSSTTLSITSPTTYFVSSGKNTDTKSSREFLYAERREKIKQGCKSQNRTMTNEFTSSWYLIEKQHNILYCPIPKVGSTFWKLALTVIGSKKEKRSIFDMRLGDTRLSSLRKLTMNEKLSLIENGTSMVFIRDPYARLFSSYENKLYNANGMFWKTTGREIVKFVRNSIDGRYDKYGVDVTFPEFVSYILYQHDTFQPINRHFKPMHEICDPCKHKYHYIGKLETFKDDVEYIFDKWRNQFHDVKVTFDDFEKESAIHQAERHTSNLFGHKSIAENEIKYPFINLMLRTWRDLQIRGFMSKESQFPYEMNSNIEDVTQHEFFEECLKGIEATVNTTAAKQQRDEALIQAYRSVPMADMERLRMYVLEDCRLFGFDDRPSKLFDRSTPLNSKFVYLDGI